MYQFPSPRGVELHKPWCGGVLAEINLSFRPLAGLSCINREQHIRLYRRRVGAEFPSPRGVELHKPRSRSLSLGPRIRATCFRPLAGLSCINLSITREPEGYEGLFPSPRGVELHKPFRFLYGKRIL